MTLQDILRNLLNQRNPALELDTGDLNDLLSERTERPHLIDIREPEELVETGHLQGATHIPMNVIHHVIPHHVPDRSHEIVLYCRSGNRSYVSAKQLQNLGYTNVRSLRGGIQALHRDGFPIVG